MLVVGMCFFFCLCSLLYFNCFYLLKQIKEMLDRTVFAIAIWNRAVHRSIIERSVWDSLNRSINSGCTSFSLTLSASPVQSRSQTDSVILILVMNQHRYKRSLIARFAPLHNTFLLLPSKPARSMICISAKCCLWFRSTTSSWGHFSDSNVYVFVQEEVVQRSLCRPLCLLANFPSVPFLALALAVHLIKFSLSTSVFCALKRDRLLPLASI